MLLSSNWTAGSAVLSYECAVTCVAVGCQVGSLVSYEWVVTCVAVK